MADNPTPEDRRSGPPIVVVPVETSPQPTPESARSGLLQAMRTTIADTRKLSEELTGLFLVYAGLLILVVAIASRFLSFDNLVPVEFVAVVAAGVGIVFAGTTSRVSTKRLRAEQLADNLANAANAFADAYPGESNPRA